MSLLRITINTVVIMFIFISSIDVISARAYEPSSNANFEILASETRPQPARPGQDMFVKINVENYGRKPAKNVVLEIENNYPFHLKYSNTEHNVSKHYTEPRITIPKISEYGNYEAFYYFTVDPNAKSGVYELTFKVSSTENNIVSRMKNDEAGYIRNIKIYVEGKPDLEIESLLSDEVIQPGENFNLSIKVNSVGTGNAKNARINLDVNGLPMIVPLDDNSRFLSQLDAGKSEIVDFRLQLSEEAKAKTYNLPINVSFTDETEQLNFSTIETIGFLSRGKAELNFASIKTDPVLPKEGNPVELTLRVENPGKVSAKSVQVYADHPFRGNKQSFVGTLESNEDGPATFSFIIDKMGKYEFPVTITYNDDFGEHELKTNVTIYASEGGSNTGSSIAIVFLLLIIGGFLYRSSNSKKGRDRINRYLHKNSRSDEENKK
jgi:hypothetical protein